MRGMKAIGARQFFPVSDPGCLVEFEAEMPVPGAKDLLVRVRAVAVNPVDTKVRKLLGDAAAGSAADSGIRCGGSRGGGGERSDGIFRGR